MISGEINKLKTRAMEVIDDLNMAAADEQFHEVRQSKICFQPDKARQAVIGLNGGRAIGC